MLIVVGLVLLVLGAVLILAGIITLLSDTSHSVAALVLCLVGVVLLRVGRYIINMFGPGRLMHLRRRGRRLR